MNSLNLIPTGMLVNGFKRVVALSFVMLFLPMAVAVAEPINGTYKSEVLRSDFALLAAESIPEGSYIISATLTAYSSSVNETDSNPCQPALASYNLCAENRENVVANNGLPLGAKIMIPRLYGNKVLTVVDRKNRRYGAESFDLWKKSKQSALAFGVQKADIIVLPS